ncbi:MAG: hypothetical protein ACNA8W_18405 [Bradymonadaceae bacterium]
MQCLSKSFILLMGLLLAASLAVVGCGKKDSAAQDLAALSAGPQFSTSRDEEGFVVQHFDATGDGVADVIRYFEEFPDPSNPAVTRRRMRKMEIDVNGDGKVNIRRFYDDHVNIHREELDKTLDGKIDTINHYDGSNLARKEILDPGENRVLATRYYTRNVIERVEKDTSGNDQIDYWEYYEEGVLTRVGRDHTGDGRADHWQQR